MVPLSLLATHDQEPVEKRIIAEDFSKDKVATFSRSFNNFLGRTLEKCPEKRSTLKEVFILNLVATRLMDQNYLNITNQVYI